MTAILILFSLVIIYAWLEYCKEMADTMILRAMIQSTSKDEIKLIDMVPSNQVATQLMMFRDPVSLFDEKVQHLIKLK